MQTARKGTVANGLWRGNERLILSAIAYRTVTRQWPMHRRIAEPLHTNKETVDA